MSYYISIVDEYVKLLEDIFWKTPFVVPIYTESQIDVYLSEYGRYPFEGILIWSQKPITTTNEIILDNYQQFLSDNYSSISNNLPGMFVIPQFGRVRGKYTGDFSVIINFDFNIDKDTYGYWQKIVFDGFIDKHEFLLKQRNYELIPGLSIYPVFSEITPPARTSTTSTFLRKSILIQIKYCKLTNI